MQMSAATTIKKIRIQLCLERIEFAQKLGISHSSLCNYETGVRAPKLSVIRKIRELAKENGMDVPVDDFFTD